MKNEVLSGSVRFGLAIMHPDLNADFNITPLGSLNSVFIVSKEHPLAGLSTVSPYQISRYPLIGPGPDSAEGSILDAYFRNRGYRPYMLLYSNEASEVMELVKNSGSIIGCVADLDVEKGMPVGIEQLKQTDRPEEMQIVLISRRDAPVNRWEKSFRNALVSSFGKD